MSSIKQDLENLIYEIGQGTERKALHSQALSILIKLNEVESSALKLKRTSPDDMPTRAEEISKVSRRLPKWARNPQQVNTRILSLFLTLKEEGVEEVTRDMLRDRLKNEIDNFETNFHGLCNSGPKNHGKVFELKGETVTIWEPVAEIVQEFEEAMGRNRS
jgi:hypothetical protein